MRRTCVRGDVQEATECCDEDQGDEPLQTASLVCEAGWNCLERAPTGGTFQPRRRVGDEGDAAAAHAAALALSFV